MGNDFHGFHYRSTKTFNKHDVIMVIVDKLSKVAYFILLSLLLNP
jgi:hypothetical protein